MNYIKTINQFWKLRRSKRITNLQADLYFFLLQESSSRGNGDNWENPFQCSNGLVCTSIGISEKALIDARNALQQIGLIGFESGITKQKAPRYYLPESLPTVSNPVSIQGGIAGGNPVSNPVGNEGNIYNKRNGNRKQNETKQSSRRKAPGEKTEYWNLLRDAWIDFHKKNKGVEPTFNSAAAKNLKLIVDRLKKLNQQAQQPQEWSEVYALRIFSHFLTKAWADPWLSDNFLLKNLYSQFDKIISNGKGTKTAQTTIGQKFGSNENPNDYRGGFAAGMG